MLIMARIVFLAPPRNCENYFDVNSRLVFLVKPTKRYIIVGDSLCVQPVSSFIDAGVRDHLDVDLNVSQESDHSSRPKYSQRLSIFEQFATVKRLSIDYFFTEL